jgi:exopolysaccharide production protein ExoQ
MTEVVARRDRWLAIILFLSVATFEWNVLNVSTQVAYAIKYGTCGAVIIQALAAPRSGSGLSGIGRIVTSLSILSAVSIFWSLQPGRAAFGTFDLALVSAAALSLGMRFNGDELIGAFAQGAIILLSLSFLNMHLTQSATVDAFGHRAWSGLLSNENEFGRQMVFAAFLFWGARARHFIYYAAFAVALIAAVMTGSAQVIVVGVFAAGATGLATLVARATRWRSAVAVMGSVSLCMIGYLLLPTTDQALSILGKDESLSNRLPLWKASLDVLSTHWVEGYGMNSVWSDKVIQGKIAIRSGFVPDQAHNSYLDAFLQLGFLGPVFILILLGSLVAVGLRRMSTVPNAAITMIGLVSATALYSMSASMILRTPVEMYWLTLIGIGSTLASPPSMSEKVQAENE